METEHSNNMPSTSFPEPLLSALSQLHDDFAKYEDGAPAYSWVVIARQIDAALDAYKLTEIHTAPYSPDPESEDLTDILVDEMNELLKHWDAYGRAPKEAFINARNAAIDMLNAFAELRETLPEPVQAGATAPKMGF